MKIIINEEIYCLEAVEKAAYRFIDKLTILISKENNEFLLDIKAVAGHEEGLEKNIDDFKRELLDQKLRKRIKDETEPVRNLILSYAFSRTGLQE